MLSDENFVPSSEYGARSAEYTSSHKYQPQAAKIIARAAPEANFCRSWEDARAGHSLRRQPAQPQLLGGAAGHLTPLGARPGLTCLSGVMFSFIFENAILLSWCRPSEGVGLHFWGVVVVTIRFVGPGPLVGPQANGRTRGRASEHTGVAQVATQVGTLRQHKWPRKWAHWGLHGGHTSGGASGHTGVTQVATQVINY